MSRRARIGLIVLAVIVFVAITIVVGRFLGAATAERNEATDVIKLQAEGKADQVVDRIEGCRANPACVARTTAQVQRLHTPGRVTIVRVDDAAGLGLGSSTDTARIVWKAGTRLPTVQCVRVRRSGNPISGYNVDVLALSATIGREASCTGN